MHEQVNELYTSAYLQVIHLNKVPLEVLPSLYMKYSPEDTSPLTHLQSSSVHSPRASNKPRAQTRKNAFITHQPHPPGLHISRAHPLYWFQNVFREALFEIITFHLPPFFVGTIVITWIKSPGLYWRRTIDPIAEYFLVANGGRWLEIIGGSVIEEDTMGIYLYWRWQFW